MVALVVTIIVILILAGISIGQGDKAIKISQLENLRTNMLLIQTKSKEYLENANFNLGTNIDNVTEEEKTNRVNKAYDIKNDEAEIYNQKGFEKENKTYYSLSEIKNLQA